MNQGVCDIRKGTHPEPLKRVCFNAATLRYPAMWGGYMLLCNVHGEKHRAYCEAWDGEKWVKPAEKAGAL